MIGPFEARKKWSSGRCTLELIKCSDCGDADFDACFVRLTEADRVTEGRRTNGRDAEAAFRSAVNRIKHGFYKPFEGAAHE